MVNIYYCSSKKEQKYRESVIRVKTEHQTIDIIEESPSYNSNHWASRESNSNIEDTVIDLWMKCQQRRNLENRVEMTPRIQSKTNNAIAYADEFKEVVHRSSI